MAAAVTRFNVIHGTNGSPTYASAEAPSVLTLNRADNESAASPVIIPSVGNGLNSAYSNYKSLQLEVVTAGTTNVSNIRIRKAATETSGLRLFTKTTPPSSYDQCTGSGLTQGNRPADASAALTATPHPDTPSGWSVIPVSPSTLTIDAGPLATNVTGQIGKIATILLGVSSAYAGGPSSAAVLPGVTLVFDEA